MYVGLSDIIWAKDISSTINIPLHVPNSQIPLFCSAIHIESCDSIDAGFHQSVCQPVGLCQYGLLKLVRGVDGCCWLCVIGMVVLSSVAFDTAADHFTAQVSIIPVYSS